MIMGQPIGVKVVEVCKVGPNGSTIPTSLPLTFFDLRWLRFPSIQCLSFYALTSTSYFFDHVLPKLKLSLSLTLQHCFPIAGNLTWPHHSPRPLLKYEPGDAVSLTIAVSDSSGAFNHLSGTPLREALECHPLLPHLAITNEQASVMALQVTVFANSGFSIGLTAHHAAMDGIAATIFCKLWACICFNLEESSSSLKVPVPKKLIPFHDRTMIKDPTGISERLVNELLKDGRPNNRSLMVWNWDQHLVLSSAIRGTFELTRSDLEMLKRYVQSKLKKKVHLSTFLIASAYVWTCLVKAEKTEAEEVSFLFAVDCRPRLDPPIASSYFGNCTAGHMASAKRSRIVGNDGLVCAVEAISEALSKLENDDGDELLRGAENWVSRMHSIRKGNRVHSISGSPIFRVYDNDFGWGRPMKMEMTSIDRTGAFSLWDSRNGGVEIGLVLNKSEMDVFAPFFVQGLEWMTVHPSLVSKI